MNYQRKKICGKYFQSAKLKKLHIAGMGLLFFLLCFLIPQNSMAKIKGPKMNCKAYVVMDAGSGEVLFGQKENKKIYPASTAKLMTAIVCTEQGDVNSTIKTSSDVLDSTTIGAYCVGLYPGRKFSFKDLLGLSLVASAADATDSLAVGVFGSREACAEAMNAKCQDLGLSKTSFDNPVGNDIGAGFDKTYATAKEMALITRYAMANPLIREIVRKSHYQTTTGQDIDANSTNWFLRGIIPYDSDRYQIIGSKSGTTLAAAHVFIATATDDDGHEIIVGYFGGPSKESTFAGIRKLFNYTYKKYDQGKLELTGKCDDVRASDIGKLFDTYAHLHTYPTGGDGRYHPNASINRTQLAKMIKNIDASDAYPGLKYKARTFADGNKNGKVTAADAASFIQDIYPAHMSKKKVKKILSDCSNTEELGDNEKEAFAVFVSSGLIPDDSCKNARQIITRKQALILTDKLADYQIKYAAGHIVGEGYIPTQPMTECAPPLMPLNCKWKKIYEEKAAAFAAQQAAVTQTP